MEIRYLGLQEIRGPLVFLEGVSDVGFDEMVTLYLDDGSTRTGRVVLLDEDRVGIQVFEGNEGISKTNLSTKFMGHPMQFGVSKEVLGRHLNGVGEVMDGLGPVFSKKQVDINGLPLNPVARRYPVDCIQTGISAIDGLITLIRGQKLPIFSGSGLPHNELALQIALHANVAKAQEQSFCIVFAAMGVTYDVAHTFSQALLESQYRDRVVLFTNMAQDPIIERILTPRYALSAAEYLAFEEHMHVLVILSDMTSYCEALREFSSAKEEIPGRKGYPGYLYSDLASLYERAGMIEGVEGSLTQLPILTMPNDDITHPIPDLTGYITEGQIVLDRDLHQHGIFPPIGVLPSLSRLMKDGIGEGFTREDHPSLSNQLFASYAHVQELRALAGVIGEDEMSATDKQYLLFGRLFEQHFLNQGKQTRDLLDSLDLGWLLLSVLDVKQWDRLDERYQKNFYQPELARQTFGLQTDTGEVWEG